jgi:hypothetical protein
VRLKYIKAIFVDDKVGEDLLENIKSVYPEHEVSVTLHNTHAAHHFFSSSILHWRTHSDLHTCLSKQYKADRQTNIENTFKITSADVWRVPGPSDSSYPIENYAPDVEGAEFIATVKYPTGSYS